ncbi:hypothetical protein ACFQNE_14095 [Gordonia phosphorivorans]|uniref:Uncharacterized protein n=1 Tax=Gordonia phosphorivorans TaxID=1056982 RepID=A0ABV6HA93_9ACTN
MTDPAEEAVDRAFAPYADRDNLTLRKAGLLAAREALAPLRAREVPALLDKLAEILSHLVMDTDRDQELTDRFVVNIRGAAHEISRLIYSSDELDQLRRNTVSVAADDSAGVGQ